ncbi:MAG: aminotransferase class I/II-fold pyridoxal phosphate-dependent enzyme, partial [Candidatus Bipolaricaulota bacterium]
MTKSKTQSINDRASQMAREGHDIIDLGAGDPRFREPETARHAGIKAIRSGFTGYTEAGGVPELREAIGRRYARIFGVELDEDEVLVTPG